MIVYRYPDISSWCLRHENFIENDIDGTMK